MPTSTVNLRVTAGRWVLHLLGYALHGQFDRQPWGWPGCRLSARSARYSLDADSGGHELTVISNQFSGHLGNGSIHRFTNSGLLEVAGAEVKPAVPPIAFRAVFGEPPVPVSRYVPGDLGHNLVDHAATMSSAARIGSAVRRGTVNIAAGI